MTRQQHRKEGPVVAGGADWTRRNLVWERLRAKGPAAIQAEIDKLWKAIVMRTDVLVEFELMKSQLEREEKKP